MSHVSHTSIGKKRRKRYSDDTDVHPCYLNKYRYSNEALFKVLLLEHVSFTSFYNKEIYLDKRPQLCTTPGGTIHVSFFVNGAPQNFVMQWSC